MGVDVLGADVTHHLVKFALVIKLSYAFVTSSVDAHAVPVPDAVPPSVTSLDVPHTLATPPPAQVCGDVHVPQLVTVRWTPQLSLAVTCPQFLASREQNAASLSGVHDAPPSNIWSSVSCVVPVLPLFAVMRRRNCWYAVLFVKL